MDAAHILYKYYEKPAECTLQYALCV